MYHQLPSSHTEAEHAALLPTRLLDLGRNVRTLRHTGLRLVTTRPGDRGHYMTLSHRWGTEHQLKLTKATLNAQEQIIRFQSLPRTYRDAVKVTLSLGYRYLWIDALCIIQDDHEDWLQEAAKMALVYRNSSCTISAHAAHSDDDGFLCANNHIMPGHFGDRPNVSVLITASHLSHRGWVFQERILSRRLLHFTPGGLFLEDASGIVTSCGSPPEIYDPSKDNKLNLEDANQNLCEWYRLVEKFTHCQLTVDTDRLPALLGLARYYEEQNDDGQYLWGLWSRSIHQGLLWINVDESPKKLLQGYDAASGPAPTWTWAHLLGRIRYPDHVSSCEPCCEVIDLDAATLSARLSRGEPPSLVVQLKTVDLEDAKVIHKPKSFMGVEFCHLLYYKRRAWVSLDDERNHDVVFPQLTLAFVSHNHFQSTFSYDDLQLTEHTWVYYFLLLRLSKLDAPARYQRIGLGAFECTPYHEHNNRELRLGDSNCIVWDEADWRIISLC
ncbi:HET-domain-containing protein [Diaporthe amygdali]|uniref:HET-domain-containing protein n=1 Tax=Phomopsis amygdali TaxID=1214568 RepID=UPI0022FE3990|nr:HET-domain-containing protein [Diaporthe amygdali]KAJ0109463.1 HET-domain-containing protein [Diaporthe amygdali]